MKKTMEHAPPLIDVAPVLDAAIDTLQREVAPVRQAVSRVFSGEVKKEIQQKHVPAARYVASRAGCRDGPCRAARPPPGEHSSG